MNDLFQEMREGETFANVSMREEIWYNVKKMFDKENIAYRHHFNKEVNGLYETNEELKMLYREKNKITNKIFELEQKLNKIKHERD